MIFIPTLKALVMYCILVFFFVTLFFFVLLVLGIHVISVLCQLVVKASAS